MGALGRVLRGALASTSRRLVSAPSRRAVGGDAFSSSSSSSHRAWSSSIAPFASESAPSPSGATPAATARDDLALTEACVRRLRELAASSSGITDGGAESKQPNDDGAPLLRVAVDGGGCSGFQYSFSLDSAPGVKPNDRVFERDGARVVVDDVSLTFLKGATVDYVEEMIKSSFAISDNPNAESGCGCGSSFVAK